MVRWRLILATVSLLAAIGSPAQSQDRSPQFRLPVQCEFPHECYVQSYVDLEPGPAAVDHACGINTYDGHRGTDFRLRSLDLMDRGVPVVAAAAGTAPPCGLYPDGAGGDRSGGLPTPPTKTHLGAVLDHHARCAGPPGIGGKAVTGSVAPSTRLPSRAAGAAGVA